VNARPRCGCAGPTSTGQAQEEQFDGLWATCVQHEIDHLNGRLFIDYLGPLKRQMITRKMQKLKREQARA
jgi:peptide deformylase